MAMAVLECHHRNFPLREKKKFPLDFGTLDKCLRDVARDEYSLREKCDGKVLIESLDLHSEMRFDKHYKHLILLLPTLESRQKS
jgi:hypothetical protein